MITCRKKKYFNAPFRSCIEINSIFIDSSENCDVVIYNLAIFYNYCDDYNLLEYSGDYSLTSGRWRNYSRVETGEMLMIIMQRPNYLNTISTTTSPYRRLKLTSASTNTTIKHRRNYSSQISSQFLQVTEFIFLK